MLASLLEQKRLLKTDHEDWWVQEGTGNDMALLSNDITLKKKSIPKFLIEKLENNTGNVEKQREDS